MKLSNATKFTPYVVKKISVDSKTARRLKELGLFVGAQIQLVAFSPLKSSVLVEVDDVRVAISRTVANQMEVVENER
jgi:Fe2+ transport system protein FeoA